MKIFDFSALKSEVVAVPTGAPAAVLLVRDKIGRINPILSTMSALERELETVQKVVGKIERIYEGVEADAYFKFLD